VYVGNPIVSVLSFSESTWLSNDVSPYEYIPSSKDNIYAKNRKDGYGGVLLAISNQLTSTQITKAGRAMSRYQILCWVYKIQ
jgi:hypothetical protein